MITPARFVFAGLRSPCLKFAVCFIRILFWVLVFVRDKAESPGKTRQVFRSSDVREKSAAPGEFISNPPRGFTRAGLVSGDFGRWCSEDCDKNVFALMRRT